MSPQANGATEPDHIERYAEPDPAGWISFTHLPSGHLISTVWVDRTDIDMHGVPYGTCVRDPEGTWTEQRRYATEDLARAGHAEIVAALTDQTAGDAR